MRRELYHGGLSNIGKTFAVFVAFIYRRRFSIEPILPHFAQPIRDSRVPRRKQPIIIRFLCYYSKNVAVTDELPPPHNHTYGFAVSPEARREPDADDFAGVRFYGFKNASLLK